MDSLINAISTVGFPIVCVGCCFYYIFKTQSRLIDVISENNTLIKQLIEREEVRINEVHKS